MNITFTKRILNWLRISVVTFVLLSLLYYLLPTPTPNFYATYASLTKLPTRFLNKSYEYESFLQELSLKYFDHPGYAVYFLSMMTVESSLNPTVVNKIGACGLTQFMPDTWRWMQQMYPETLRGKSCTDPRANIEAAFLYAKLNASYLPSMEMCDQLSALVASHNAGPGRVGRLYQRNKITWKQHLPLETRNYLKAVDNVSRLYVGKGWETLGCLLS